MNLNNPVSSIGEKALIEIISNKNPNNYIGDDAAVLDNNINNLIVSSDMLIQSHHLPKQMSYFQMGFKVVTVNVSDIASMGAKPKYFLLSIAIPKNLKISSFNSIIDGVIEACRYYNIEYVGGDTNEADEIILSGTILGFSDKDSFVLKTGFNKGDLLCITGSLGLAALGFKLLDSNITNGKVDFYKNKILQPHARVDEGLILKDFATSLTDITDGLSEELYSMINSSNHGFNIYEDKLPISNDFKDLSNSLGLNYLDLFFNFGEDFELVFTLPPTYKDELNDLIDFCIIGEVTDSGSVNFITSNGEIKVLDCKGYEHLN